jgi:hypothetical protein
MRSAVAVLALSTATLVLAGAAFAAFAVGPSIEPRQNLPADVAELTASTWLAFERAFPSQASCLSDVELALVDDVPGGAADYVVAEHLIRIEIPTSPRRYVESLIHELAHHLDAVCDGELEVGPAFRVAQEIPADAPWERAEAWEERPMEQFAETVVEYVTGDRYTHADIIDVSAEALAVVRDWAGVRR